MEQRQGAIVARGRYVDTFEPAQRAGKVLSLQVQLADVEADQGVDAGATGTSLIEERRRQARVEREARCLSTQRPHLSRRAVGEQQVAELGRECQQRLLRRQAVRGSPRPGEGGEPGSTRPLLLLQRLDERPMQPAVIRDIEPAKPPMAARRQVHQVCLGR